MSGDGFVPLRKEDARLLSGRARFTDDVHLDGMVHAAFVRSPFAHAEIVSIRASAAIEAGALLVLTAEDIPFIDRAWAVRFWHPSIRNGLPPLLARHKVRHVGEPVALVISANRYLAEDHAELVDVEYRPLGPVATTSDAQSNGAPQLHPDWTGNVAANFRYAIGDAEAALRNCTHRLSRAFSYGRQTPLPLETRGCVADFDQGRSSLTLWLSTQTHYSVRQNLAQFLDIPEYKVRVIAEDVGGGFGGKSRPYPEEILISHASQRLRRPVKWIEDRLEHMQSTTHSRSIDTLLEVGYDERGKIEALKGRLVVDVGGYVFTSGIITAQVAAGHCTGPYKIPNIAVEVVCVGTNKTPLATYRGAGQPEATFPLECLIELVGKSLGISGYEVRQRNLVRPSDMPYPFATLFGPKAGFESGDFPEVLRRAAATSGYTETVETLPSGERTAWGLACAIESTGYINFESACIRIDTAGNVTVASGMSSQGQGQATTFGQVCAEILGVSADRVTVRMGDTGLVPFGRGAFASRGAVVGANAVAGAARSLREKVLTSAGTLLQCDPKLLAIEDGRIVRTDKQPTPLTVGDIARATSPGGPLFAGDPALEAHHIFDTKDMISFAFSVHVARVALDPRTGFYKVVRYVVVHDVGRMLNPTIVEGQVVGGIVEGIGGTLFSEIRYDDQAQLLTGTLADYLVATAPDVPRIELDHVETTPTTNPLGVRGVGEGGVIAVAPAIANALARAIDPAGTGHEQSLFKVPITSMAVLSACRSKFGELSP